MHNPPSPVSPPNLSGEPSLQDEDTHWLQHVYRGDRVRQLSPRAIISGMLIGAVMSVSNLYIGLKTGWSLGVTITSSIIAFGVFTALERLLPGYKKNPLTILENNTIATVASAAGFMSAAGLVSALPALYLTTGRILTAWEMIGWLTAVSLLGVFMAIPLKRQMINIDKLPFPSGIATAATLTSIHSADAQSLRQAKSLVWGGLVGGVVALWRDGLGPLAHWLTARVGVGVGVGSPGVFNRLANLALPNAMPLFPGGEKLLERYTIGLEGSAVMIAAGAIIGIRVGASLLLGALFFYGLLGPWLVGEGICEPGYRGIVGWILWPSTALMVTASMTSFLLRWRTIVHALSMLGKLFKPHLSELNPLAQIDVPAWWFIVGTVVSGAACIYLGNLWFSIVWWMGLIAVAATFILSIVAARATGETDVTPIGALGKVTQLMYSVIAPSNITTNLMTASITSGAAAHAADLLKDLKCGHLLGANPRKQTVAQFFGVAAGSLFCVPVYTLVVDPAKIGTEELPAPAAKVWASVAKMLANGLHSLPRGAVTAMAIASVLGVALSLMESYLPVKYRRWLPSATGLGIAGVIPGYNSISMFAGALAAWLLFRTKPKLSEGYTIPVASGIIAGESLTGVAIIILSQGGSMLKAVFGF